MGTTTERVSCRCLTLEQCRQRRIFLSLRECIIFYGLGFECSGAVDGRGIGPVVVTYIGAVLAVRALPGH